MMRRPQAVRTAGFGVVEMMLSISLFAGLLAAFSLSLKANTADQSVAMSLEDTRAKAERALSKVQDALALTNKRSGFPIVFAQGGAVAVDPTLTYPQAHARAGMPAANELVFQVPEDLDADGWPDVDAVGDLILNPVPSVLAVVGEVDGTNSLVTLDGGPMRTTLARRIGSMVVDDSASSGFAIPLDSLRVRILLNADVGLSVPVVKSYETRVIVPNLEDLP